MESIVDEEGDLFYAAEDEVAVLEVNEPEYRDILGESDVLITAQTRFLGFYGKTTFALFCTLTNMADAFLRTLLLIVFIYLFWTQQWQVIENCSSNIDYRGHNKVFKTISSLRQQFQTQFFTPRGITTWPTVKRKFGSRRIGYYPNSSSSFKLLLLRTGDVERNPGEKRVCSTCQTPIAKKHHSLICSLRSSSYHINCSGISTKQLRNLHAGTQLQKLWPIYNHCHW